MANIIKIKRGLKADIDKLTLQAGELGVTLDTQELYVGDASGNRQLIKGAAAGVVETATKLESPRNISISGDATGSTSFDGSADATIALTLANSGVTAGTYNNVTVNAKGLITSASNKTYTIEDITGLEDALNAKAVKADVEAALKEKADSISVYTKTETNNLLQGKADSTAVYTSTKVDELLAAKANSADLKALATKDKVAKTDLATELASELDAKATITAMNAKADQTTVEQLEDSLTASINAKATKATDLAGYGITDAYTKTEVDGMIAGTFHFEGEVASYEALPTDASKGDVYQVGDKEYAWDGDNWVELGFNIDLSAYATSENVAKTYATQTSLIEGLATKANSTDVYTKTQVYTKTEADAAFMTNAEVEAKGYATTSAMNTALADKADKATTLSGYGITDAYTKTEIDNKVTTINNTLATKLDASSTIDGGTF